MEVSWHGGTPNQLLGDPHDGNPQDLGLEAYSSVFPYLLSLANHSAAIPIYI